LNKLCRGFEQRGRFSVWALLLKDRKSIVL
jgi:hypothetical protein